jgi:hypothetical protein
MSSSGPSGEPYSARVSVSRVEVAVVGAGICGLSAGYALRRRGVDFCVFEAGVPGSGQSAGRTRVFRNGHDDERLVSLAVRARGEWERLEGELGARVLGRQGVLICGPNVAERAAAFEAAGVPARLVQREGQIDALPVIAPPEDEALLDETGGSIDVRAAVDGLAVSLGDRLIIATVFQLRDGSDGAHGELVYAAPMPNGREYAVGLGTEHEPPVDEALARLRAYVERGMPGLDPEPASVRLCQTSILPWGADAFGVWRTGRIDVLAGANLFKFAPLIGELLAGGSDELSPDRQLGRPVTASRSGR